MTRETKLGLVVASVFVGLTTVVVVSRLKQTPGTAPEAKAHPPIVVTAPTPPPPSAPLAIPGGTPAPEASPPNVLPASASEAVPLNATPDSVSPSRMIEDGKKPEAQLPPAQGRSGAPANGKPEFDFQIPDQMVQNTPSAAAPPPLPPAPAVNPNTKPATPDLATPPSLATPAASPNPDTLTNPMAPPPTKPASPTPISLDPAAPELVRPGDPAGKPASPTPIPLSKLGPAPAPAVPTPVPVNPPTNPDAAKPNGLSPNTGTPSQASGPGLTSPGMTNVPNPAVPAPLPAAVEAQTGKPAPDLQLPGAQGIGSKPGQDPVPPAPLPVNPAAKPLTDPAPVVPPTGPTSPAPTNSTPGTTPGFTPPAPAPTGTGNLSTPPAMPTPVDGFGKPAAGATPNGLPASPVPAAAPIDPRANPLMSPGPGDPVAPAPANPGRVSSGDVPGAPGQGQPVARAPSPLEVAQAGASAMPPVGAPANVASPPVKVPVPAAEAPKPAVGTVPSVKIYDEQTYTCKPEDTSFEALSKRFYTSPAYAQALLRFNREHPLRDDEFRSASPQLRPGTRVRIPPVALLESNYADAIPNLKPLPDVPARGPVSTGQSSPVSQSDRPPPPVVAVTPPPGGPASVAVPPVSVPTPAQGAVVPVRGGGQTGRVYTVAPGGEPISQIAQRTLGDWRRWNEIYRINQNLEPREPIPAGTQVLLPADARPQP
jgi:hypothetical protein